MPIPLRGDRSAWNTDYPELHAKDIEDNVPVRHLPSGAVFGDVPVWTGIKWETMPSSGSGTSGSGGDMYRATYDTDMDGVVDAAEAVPWTGVTGKPSTFAPSSHAVSHASGGADPVKLDDLAAPDDNADLNASVSRHGLLLKLTGSASAFLRADGSWATPPGGWVPAHAFTHVSSGSDAIKLDDLAAPDDNTDLNASTSKHGLLLKLAGGTSSYLRADGAWATPPDQNDNDKVRVTTSDDTPDYLDDKLLAGDNITLTLVNPGGYEQIRISSGSDAGSGASVNPWLVQFFT
jgi:hypothetical protein